MCEKFSKQCGNWLFHFFFQKFQSNQYILIRGGKASSKLNFYAFTAFYRNGHFPPPNQLTVETRLERVIEKEPFHISLYNKNKEHWPLWTARHTASNWIYVITRLIECTVLSIAQINVHLTGGEAGRWSAPGYYLCCSLI